MNTRKFSLRSLFGKLLGKRHAPAAPPEPKSRHSTSARERVRSGIEPLEGRIAPAILVNGHLLTYHDADGDLVTVKFSKDIFDLNAVGLPGTLDSVFKFSDGGKAHTGPANATDDGPQQLQLIDLGKVPVKIVNGTLKSVVAGVSFTITSAIDPGSGMPPGDGLAAIGAINAGTNALGAVTIDGDIGQIDAGVSSAKTGLTKLDVQSIGKFGTSTQKPGAMPPTAQDPAPSLESKIVGKLGKLIVAGDVQGYVHVVDAAAKRGTIGKVTVAGSLIGNLIGGAASDNTGRIESSFDIGNVMIGTDSSEGIRGGGGKNSGALTAGHAIGNVTISGGVIGSTAEGSGTIFSGGAIGKVKVGGALTGDAGVRSGSIRSGGTMGDVTIGTFGATKDITGGTGDSSGLVTSNGNIGNVHVFGGIVGNGPHSGGIFAIGDLKSVTVEGGLTGGANLASGAIEGLKNVGPVSIGGDVLGKDGAGSGVIAAGGKLGNVTIEGNLTGGKGANSGAILGGQDPGKSVRSLGDVTLTGALMGDEGNGSGEIRSGGNIGAVKIGTALTSGLAMRGGIGALSGAIFAGGAIEKVTVFRGVEGGVGAGSASIQSHGLIGSVSISGDLTGGTGAGSASILSHELSSIARPVAGEIGSIFISGKLDGEGDRTALIQADGRLGKVTVAAIEGGTGSYSGAIVSGAGFVKPGATSFINVTGMVEGGAGDHSGYVEIGGRLGSFTAGGLNLAAIRIANDLGSLTVNGNVTDSIVTARGEATPIGRTDLAIGSVKITGNVSNTSIRAGYDVLGAAANAQAQIGEVRVTGNWNASVLAAGVVAGTDGLLGTDDDRLMVGAHQGKIISKIAKVIIGGTVEGTAGTGDHFGFVAEQIGSFSSNGNALALTNAGGQTFELGTFTDTTVREVAFV